MKSIFTQTIATGRTKNEPMARAVGYASLIPSGPRTPRGFSLIEMVVVLAILSLAVATVSVRFATPLQRARVESTLQQWKSLDAFARGASKRGTISIALQHSKGSTTATISGRQGIIRTWACPAPIQFSVENDNGDPITEISYHRGIGTEDYRLLIQEGAILKTISFAGVTGATREPLKAKK